MKVLVTGDNGYIGRKLAISLAKKGFEVTGLDIRHDHADYETVDFDLTGPNMPNITGLSAIFHLAADTECKDEERAFRINVKGTEKMLDLAKRNKSTFIYVSTGGIYGFREAASKESDKPNPENYYAKTKQQAEELCRKYSKDFPVVILRYFFPYSASDDNRRLMNRLIFKIKNDEPVELNEGGKPTINPIAMKDAIDATIKAMNCTGFDIFNISGPDSITILDIVRMIEKELGTKAKISYNGKSVGNMIGDMTKAKSKLKFSPKTGIKEGIREIIKAGD